MKRRSFLTLLATLAAWVSLPKKSHADAIKGGFNWRRESPRALVRLWDGLTLVNGGPDDRTLFYLAAPVDGRNLVVPWRRGTGGYILPNDAGPMSDTHRTEFRHRPGGDGLNYEYVSGPKWWEDAAIVVTAGQLATTTRYGEQPSRIWHFTRAQVRDRDELLGLRFDWVRLHAGHGLTPEQQQLVTSRLRSGLYGRISFTGTSR